MVLKAILGNLLARKWFCRHFNGKEMNVQLFMIPNLRFHVFKNLGKPVKHTPWFQRDIIVNKAFRAISGDSWNWNFVLRPFSTSQTGFCALKTQWHQNLGNSEVIEVFNANWRSRPGVSGRNSLLPASLFG